MMSSHQATWPARAARCRYSASACATPPVCTWCVRRGGDSPRAKEETRTRQPIERIRPRRCCHLDLSLQPEHREPQRSTMRSREVVVQKMEVTRCQSKYHCWPRQWWQPWSLVLTRSRARRCRLKRPTCGGFEDATIRALCELVPATARGGRQQRFKRLVSESETNCGSVGAVTQLVARARSAGQFAQSGQALASWAPANRSQKRPGNPRSTTRGRATTPIPR